MAAVYREVPLEWGGKSYSLRLSYRIIQRMEQGFSMHHLMVRCLANEGRDAPLSQLADLLAACLGEAGVDVEAEQLFLKMADIGDASEGALLISAGAKLAASILPESKLASGNAGAPAETGASTKPKASDGPSTTRSPSDSTASPPASSGG